MHISRKIKGFCPSVMHIFLIFDVENLWAKIFEKIAFSTPYPTCRIFGL